MSLFSPIRRLLLKHPRLDYLAKRLRTLNLDYVGQLLHRGKYPSRFGGMWTDRSDYPQILPRKLARGTISEGDQERLEHWRRDGYVILNSLIPPETIDAYLTELQELRSRQPSPLLLTGASFTGAQPYSARQEFENRSVRTVDDYFLCQPSRRILLHPGITRFLNLVFERPPLLTQSLHFRFGSQQPIHRDTAFVRMNSPMSMAACWVALEDIEPGSGELLYCPGSHHWEDFLFHGRYLYWSESRDGESALDDYHAWLHDKAYADGRSPTRFLPRKGDVLIWHAALAHGGAAIANTGRTRLSLVGHFCPVGVRPLYHYSSPASRTVYHSELGRYTSWYYPREGGPPGNPQ